MHEGKRVEELLTRFGHKPVDLAKAAGRSKQAISKQLKQARLGKNAKLMIRRGLQRLEIDPGLLWPEEVEGNPDEDLRPLVQGWDRRHLETLRTVFLAHPTARGKLLYWVDGALRNSSQ